MSYVSASRGFCFPSDIHSYGKNGGKKMLRYISSATEDLGHRTRDADANLRDNGLQKPCDFAINHTKSHGILGIALNFMSLSGFIQVAAEAGVAVAAVAGWKNTAHSRRYGVFLTSQTGSL